MTTTYIPGVNAMPLNAVTAPTGFELSSLPMPTIGRLGGGQFTVDVDIDALRPAAGVTYYVAPAPTGATGNDGLTAATPTTVRSAEAKADVGTIVYAPGTYMRVDGDLSAPLNKSLNHIAAAPGVHITSWEPFANYAFTAYSGNVYQATRSGTTAVVDVDNLTAWGSHTVYKKVATAADVVQAGQWALVESTVYVWAIGDTNLAADETQVRLALDTFNAAHCAGAGVVQYIENITIDGGDNGLRATAGALIIAKDCRRRYASTRGVRGDGGSVISINVEVSDCGTDGFSYGGAGAEGMEINCRSHHNGLNSPGTNNGSTCHEDARVIRVGSDYDFCGGPVVADVHESLTWNLGCRSGAPDGIGASVYNASWLVDGTGYDAAPATQWLDECSADGADYAFTTIGPGLILIHAPQTVSTADPDAPASSATTDGITYYTA